MRQTMQKKEVTVGSNSDSRTYVVAPLTVGQMRQHFVTNKGQTGFEQNVQTILFGLLNGGELSPSGDAWKLEDVDAMPWLCFKPLLEAVVEISGIGNTEGEVEAAAK